MNDVSNAYFEWLCSLISNGCPGSRPAFIIYNKLLLFLHNTDFRYSISRDGNRYEDGINMRYRFSREKGVSYSQVAADLDNKPCSMLEMMVALASRCEEQIMSNIEYGDRTGVWFWSMVENLGLIEMNDRYFVEDFCRSVVNRFLDRMYQPDGTGGLFRVNVIDENHYFMDLRNYEIWCQAMWYLNSILEGESHD